MRSSRLLGFTVVLSCFAGSALAQGIVSARAGLIDYSDGTVLLNEKPLVHKASQFQGVHDGEYLRTERGRAEVLLTPGVFLRLGEDAQVEMIASHLTDVRLRLLKGSAVIEVDELNKESHIAVLVKDSEVNLLHSGLYRLDADEETPRLRVFSGEALVKADGNDYHVRGKKEIELAGDYQIQKFAAEDADALDRWSKRRASYLSVANVSAGHLAYTSGLAFAGSSWFWNPYFGMYTFLPYSNVIWSPYGYGFYSPLGAYRQYYSPRPSYAPTAQSAASARSSGASGYNSGYGYNTVGQTSSGTSGVIASRSAAGPSGPVGGGGSVGGGGGGVSRGGGGGGGRR